MVGKLAASTKVKTTFSEEEMERIISPGIEEEVLLNSLQKDYFQNDGNKLNLSSSLNFSNNCL